MNGDVCTRWVLNNFSNFGIRVDTTTLIICRGLLPNATILAVQRYGAK